MPQQTLATRMRLMIPWAFLLIAALACNLGTQPPSTNTTPGGTASQTLVAQSDIPEVEIRSPADNSEVIINTEVQVYVRAVDRQGVTRIEMRVDNLIVDTAASPEANGTPTMDSILAWTPNSTGPHVIQVVAFRGNVRGNPKSITLTVRQSAGQVTVPAGSPAFLTASPTGDPTCRIRANVEGLNVRTGPGVNYDRITGLSLGANVPVIGSNADRSWWQVNVNGVIGWVSAPYTTQLGVCSNILSVAIPASPTSQPGASPFIIPPTFTPLPTLPLPTPSSTIPVVVLPTLTWTPIPTQGPQGPSIGDLTSTAIYATQTKLAQPPTPQPTATYTPTTAPGVTASVGPTATWTQTPTQTATPQLPSLVITSVLTSSNTVVLDSVQRLATVPFIIRVANTGSAPAPTFDVAVDQADGTRAAIKTTQILNPKAEIELTINVTFSKEGPQRVVIIADSGNTVAENNETDNVTFRDMTVVVATVPGVTPTSTATATATATFTPTSTATATATTTVNVVQPTATFTATATTTATGTIIVVVPTTQQPGAVTATQCPQPTAELLQVEPVTSPTNQLTVIVTVRIGNGERVVISSEAGTFEATGNFSVNVPAQVPVGLAPNTTNHLSVSATVKKIPAANGCVYGGYTLNTTVDRTGKPLNIVQQAVAPGTATQPATKAATQAATKAATKAATQAATQTWTATATHTVVTAVAAQPTATFTFTAVPPTATFTRVPPTATFTFTAVPPTATFTAVPPTVTFTAVPPTATFTRIPPTATFTFTAVPPTATFTRIPPTATFTLVPPTRTFTPVPPTRTFTPVPPTAAPPTQPPAQPGVDLLTIPVLPNLNDPAVQNAIRGVHGAGKAGGVVAGAFAIVGDTTLVGIGGVDNPAANLDQFKGQLDPIIQFFKPGIQTAGAPTAQGGFLSADILNPGKGTGNCQGKAPLLCALDAKPAVVFISVGRNDIAANVPLDQFRNNLTSAVTTATGRGIVPVLVTITGANQPNEPKVAQYNNVIYEVAKATNVPLFNIYAIRKDAPTLINPANGTLSTNPGNPNIDFTGGGLQFGVNRAALEMLRVLNDLKNVLPLS